MNLISIPRTLYVISHSLLIILTKDNESSSLMPFDTLFSAINSIVLEIFNLLELIRSPYRIPIAINCNTCAHKDFVCVEFSATIRMCTPFHYGRFENMFVHFQQCYHVRQIPMYISVRKLLIHKVSESVIKFPNDLYDRVRTPMHNDISSLPKKS